MTSSTVPPLAIIHRQTRRGDDGVGTAAATDAHYTATDAENATDAATATTAKYATTDAFLQPLVDAMNADAIDGADSPLVELDTHEAVVVAVGEHTGTLMVETRVS